MHLYSQTHEQGAGRAEAHCPLLARSGSCDPRLAGGASGNSSPRVARGEWFHPQLLCGNTLANDVGYWGKCSEWGNLCLGVQSRPERRFWIDQVRQVVASPQSLCQGAGAALDIPRVSTGQDMYPEWLEMCGKAIPHP